MIERLGHDAPVALALSLHAPTYALRDEVGALEKKVPHRTGAGRLPRILAIRPQEIR
jgi:23S rRNA (adenine2503-C2)-methyltransferase